MAASCLVFRDFSNKGLVQGVTIGSLRKSRGFSQIQIKQWQIIRIRYWMTAIEYRVIVF